VPPGRNITFGYFTEKYQKILLLSKLMTQDLRISPRRMRPGPIYIDWDDDIIIVEGAFDAIRHKNCIPILGSSLRENHKLFQKICRSKHQIFLALDEDAKNKEFYIAKKFREYGVACKSIPVSPYSDLAEMPRAEFLDRKQNADFITDLDYLEYKLDF